MKFFFQVLAVQLCLAFTLCSETYRAAVVTANNDADPVRYLGFVRDAAKSNVDILVLPSPSLPGSSFSEPDDYDEITSSLSNAAKEGGLYVVASLYEKARCQGRNELIRNNLVFDRQGDVISVYRKPVNNVANCTTTSSPPSFSTDFGITFGLLMEEDLVLHNVRDLSNLKNFVVAGSWPLEIPLLSASQFSSSWAYVTNANLMGFSGIYSGKAGAVGSGTNLVVADLNKDCGCVPKQTAPVVHSVKKTLPGEDLSQYIIRPLDMAASAQGYTETVCHGKFCCDFYVKTSAAGSNQSSVSYGLAAFEGTRHFGRGRHVGAQSCAVFACAGLYKRSCVIGSENTTNTHFDKITISGNFTSRNAARFPIILSKSVDSFQYDTTPSHVTVQISDGENMMNFGIFGRVYSKDYEAELVNDTEGLTIDVFDYLYNEEVMEFFDYLWIRLRILLVVVSIYVLEMM